MKAKLAPTKRRLLVFFAVCLLAGFYIHGSFDHLLYPLELNEVALQVELAGPELIDLTPQVREDILLALPAYPHCEWVEGNVCVAQERTSVSPIESAAADADNGAPARSPVWGELDRLNITKPAFPD